MADLDPAHIDKATEQVVNELGLIWPDECEPVHVYVAQAVLEAVADDLRAEGADKALLNLPVSLVEFVRSSGRTQWFLARRAQITEKHLSRMLNHGEGRIDTWMRVLHAVRADQISPKEQP